MDETVQKKRRRIWIPLLLVYLSVGFLLTFTLRWEQVNPNPATTDFLDALLNHRIYLSTLLWPVWLLQSLF